MPKSITERVEPALLCLAAFLLLFSLQTASGSREAALGSYPDESAHYVTGQMLREYAMGGWRHSSPMQFAEKYYVHYPKVAFGHWPPVYYLVQGAWSLVAGSSIASWLLLQPILLALTAGVMFALVSPRAGRWSAAAISLAFCLLPASVGVNTQMMAEPLLALFGVMALRYGVKYFEQASAGAMVGFAVAASLAAFTKGSGLALFALPVTLALVLGRREVLRRAGFWWPQLVAGAAQAVWMALTWHMVRNGMEVKVTAALLLGQAGLFARMLPEALGWPLLLLAVAGIGLAWRRRRENPLLAAAAVVSVFTLGLHAVSPTGVEQRRLLLSLPPMLIAAALAWRTQRVAVLCAVASVAAVFAPVKKIQSGYERAGRLVEASTGERQAVLIASHADGEGMLIAQMAQAHATPRIFLIRASKLLASSDWSGQDYILRAADAEAAQAMMDAVPVRYAVVDRFAAQPSSPHWELARQALERHPEHWQLRHRIEARDPYAGTPGEILVYERRGADGQGVSNLEVDLRRMIGRPAALRAAPPQIASVVAP